MKNIVVVILCIILFLPSVTAVDNDISLSDDTRLIQFDQTINSNQFSNNTKQDTGFLLRINTIYLNVNVKSDYESIVNSIIDRYLVHYADDLQLNGIIHTSDVLDPLIKINPQTSPSTDLNCQTSSFSNSGNNALWGYILNKNGANLFRNGDAIQFTPTASPNIRGAHYELSIYVENGSSFINYANHNADICYEDNLIGTNTKSRHAFSLLYMTGDNSTDINRFSHLFGHLFGLQHSTSSSNVMYEYMTSPNIRGTNVLKYSQSQLSKMVDYSTNPRATTQLNNQMSYIVSNPSWLNFTSVITGSTIEVKLNSFQIIHSPELLYSSCKMQYLVDYNIEIKSNAIINVANISLQHQDITNGISYNHNYTADNIIISLFNNSYNYRAGYFVDSPPYFDPIAILGDHPDLTYTTTTTPHKYQSDYSNCNPSTAHADSYNPQQAGNPMSDWIIQPIIRWTDYSLNTTESTSPNWAIKIRVA